ncbi:MAG: sigma-70 family RNA polymerase sigma factor [Patescibacteria group bacterium]|nr:sigma-70 family RNA polymerase sigma factor [Patescibacteria group bacterium]
MSEIKELWEEYFKTRAIEQRNKLVEYYYPYVIRTATRFYNKLPIHKGQCELDTFVNDGIFGLIYAIEHYDPQKETKFETFSLLRIRGAILDGVRDRDWVPRLTRMRGDVPVQMTPISVYDWHKNQSEPDKIHNKYEPSIEDPKNPDEIWRVICKGLSKTESLLLICYFRLGLTLKETAKHLGFSEPRASQILSKLLTRLKEREEIQWLRKL